MVLYGNGGGCDRVSAVRRSARPPQPATIPRTLSGNPAYRPEYGALHQGRAGDVCLHSISIPGPEGRVSILRIGAGAKFALGDTAAGEDKSVRIPAKSVDLRRSKASHSRGMWTLSTSSHSSWLDQGVPHLADDALVNIGYDAPPVVPAVSGAVGISGFSGIRAKGLEKGPGIVFPSRSIPMKSRSSVKGVPSAFSYAASDWKDLPSPALSIRPSRASKGYSGRFVSSTYCPPERTTRSVTAKSASTAPGSFA